MTSIVMKEDLLKRFPNATIDTYKYDAIVIEEQEFHINIDRLSGKTQFTCSHGNYLTKLYKVPSLVVTRMLVDPTNRVLQITGYLPPKCVSLRRV